MFLCVMFRDSPFLRSSYVLTNDTDSGNSVRSIHYSTSDHRVPRAPALFPHSSLTLTHWSIGYRNHNPQPLTESSQKLMYLRVYDSRESSHHPPPSPSLYYSSHIQTGLFVIANHNPQSLTESSTSTHSTLPTLTFLTITCTQVLWFLESLVRSTVSCCLTTRTGVPVV